MIFDTSLSPCKIYLYQNRYQKTLCHNSFQNNASQTPKESYGTLKFATKLETFVKFANKSLTMAGHNAGNQGIGSMESYAMVLLNIIGLNGGKKKVLVTSRYFVM